MGIGQVGGYLHQPSDELFRAAGREQREGGLYACFDGLVCYLSMDTPSVLLTDKPQAGWIEQKHA